MAFYFFWNPLKVMTRNSFKEDKKKTATIICKEEAIFCFFHFTLHASLQSNAGHFLCLSWITSYMKLTDCNKNHIYNKVLLSNQIINQWYNSSPPPPQNEKKTPQQQQQMTFIIIYHKKNKNNNFGVFIFLSVWFIL